jgi:GntR family transcriptional regulator
MLEFKAGEAAVQIRRLLLAGRDRPVVLDEIWLPGPLFKGLTAERLSGWRGPMYGLFEAEFGVRMIRAEEKIRAVAADADDAALLAVAAGRAAAAVERLSFTYGDKPVECAAACTTPSFHYRNELN